MLWRGKGIIKEVRHRAGLYSLAKVMAELAKKGIVLMTSEKTLYQKKPLGFTRT
jgi:hypothetical protein